MRLTVFFFILCIFFPCVAQEAKPNVSAGVTFPTPSSPTVPQEAMFALGQQSGKLDAMSERLGRLEQDVKDIGKDVSWMKTIMLIIGGVLTLVVAPIIVAQVTYWIQKRIPISSR